MLVGLSPFRSAETSHSLPLHLLLRPLRPSRNGGRNDNNRSGGGNNDDEGTALSPLLSPPQGLCAASFVVPSAATHTRSGRSGGGGSGRRGYGLGGQGKGKRQGQGQGKGKISIESGKKRKRHYGHGGHDGVGDGVGVSDYDDGHESNNDSDDDDDDFHDMDGENGRLPVLTITTPHSVSLMTTTMAYDRMHHWRHGTRQEDWARRRLPEALTESARRSYRCRPGGEIGSGTLDDFKGRKGRRRRRWRSGEGMDDTHSGSFLPSVALPPLSSLSSLCSQDGGAMSGSRPTNGSSEKVGKDQSPDRRTPEGRTDCDDGANDGTDAAVMNGVGGSASAARRVQQRRFHDSSHSLSDARIFVPPPIPAALALRRCHRRRRRRRHHHGHCHRRHRFGRSQHHEHHRYKFSTPLSSVFFALRNGNSTLCAWDADDETNADGPDHRADGCGSEGGGVMENFVVRDRKRAKWDDGEAHETLADSSGGRSKMTDIRMESGSGSGSGSGTWSIRFPGGRKASSMCPLPPRFVLQTVPAASKLTTKPLPPPLSSSSSSSSSVLGVCGALDDGTAYVAVLAPEADNDAHSPADPSSPRKGEDADGGYIGQSELVLGRFGSPLPNVSEDATSTTAAAAEAATEAAEAGTAVLYSSAHASSSSVCVSFLAYVPSSPSDVTICRHRISGLSVVESRQPASSAKEATSSGSGGINPNEAEGVDTDGDDDDDEEDEADNGEANYATKLKKWRQWILRCDEHDAARASLSLVPIDALYRASVAGSGSGKTVVVDPSSVRATTVSSGSGGGGGGGGERDSDVEGVVVVVVYRIVVVPGSDVLPRTSGVRSGADECAGWYCASINIDSMAFLSRPFRLCSDGGGGDCNGGGGGGGGGADVLGVAGLSESIVAVLFSSVSLSMSSSSRPGPPVLRLYDIRRSALLASVSLTSSVLGGGSTEADGDEDAHGDEDEYSFGGLDGEQPRWQQRRMRRPRRRTHPIVLGLASDPSSNTVAVLHVDLPSFTMPSSSDGGDDVSNGKVFGGIGAVRVSIARLSIGNGGGGNVTRYDLAAALATSSALAEAEVCRGGWGYGRALDDASAVVAAAASTAPVRDLSSLLLFSAGADGRAIGDRKIGGNAMLEEEAVTGAIRLLYSRGVLGHGEGTAHRKDGAGTPSSSSSFDDAYADAVTSMFLGRETGESGADDAEDVSMENHEKTPHPTIEEEEEEEEEGGPLINGLKYHTLAKRGGGGGDDATATMTTNVMVQLKGARVARGEEGESYPRHYRFGHNPRQLPRRFVDLALPLAVRKLLRCRRRRSVGAGVSKNSSNYHGGEEEDDDEKEEAAAPAAAVLIDLLRSGKATIRCGPLDDEGTMRAALLSCRRSFVVEFSKCRRAAGGATDEEADAGGNRTGGGRTPMPTPTSSLDVLDALLRECTDSIPERGLVVLARHVLCDAVEEEMDDYFCCYPPDAEGSGKKVFAREDAAMALARERRDRAKVRLRHAKNEDGIEKNGGEGEGEKGQPLALRKGRKDPPEKEEDVRDEEPKSKHLVGLRSKYRRASDRLLALRTSALVGWIASYSPCNGAMLRSALMEGLEPDEARALMCVLGRALPCAATGSGARRRGGESHAAIPFPSLGPLRAGRIAAWMSALADAHLSSLVVPGGMMEGSSSAAMSPIVAARKAVRAVIKQADALWGVDILLQRCVCSLEAERDGGDEGEGNEVGNDNEASKGAGGAAWTAKAGRALSGDAIYGGLAVANGSVIIPQYSIERLIF